MAIRQIIVGLKIITENSKLTRSIVLGGGCFWCLEAAYDKIEGVEAISGYAGGTVKNPTYEDVTSGMSGHAEVVKVKYDPSIITLQKVLEIFFQMHDPTTLNRQGNDYGTQYRSIILYSTVDERETIQMVVSQTQLKWKQPIVTEINILQEFYEAEEFHQQYYERNPNQGYCLVMIAPKLDKLQREILPKLELMQQF